jgi:hypothetical protein
MMVMIVGRDDDNIGNESGGDSTYYDSDGQNGDSDCDAVLIQEMVRYQVTVGVLYKVLCFSLHSLSNVFFGSLHLYIIGYHE